VFVSSHVTSHKFLEDVHEDSMQIQSQINRFLCNSLEGPLKAFGRPSVSKSFSVEDVRTSEQHCPDARSSFSNFYTELDFSRYYLGSFYKMSERCGNISSIPEYFEFPLRMQKGVTVKTVHMLGQDVGTWSYYGKNHAILERRSQKTVRKRLTFILMPTRQSSNLIRIRFFVSQ
jgi:hypothetical protein